MYSIEKLRQYLTELSIAYTVRADCIAVEPATDNGFRVALVDDAGALTVHFDFWQQSCRTGDEAEQLFLLGLSARCRMRVLCASGKALCWTLQVRENGLWQLGAITGAMPARTDVVETVYLQNDLVSFAAPEPAGQVAMPSQNYDQIMLEGGFSAG